MTSRSERDERGAIAIMVAVMATVLFVGAAISVDLGHAWAQKRRAQSQVDLAALSAGNLLPATTVEEETVVAARVADYLNNDDNHLQNQPEVDAVDLLDGNLGNGEVTFAEDGTQIDVTAPRARVDFGLARAFGMSDTYVSASASVRIFSELPSEGVLPFLLPSGCYGPSDADTSNGNSGSPSGSAGASPGAGVNDGVSGSFNSTAHPDTANQGQNDVLVRFRVTGVNVLRKQDDPVVHFQSVSDPSKRWDFTGVWTSTQGNQQWEFEVTLGAADVTAVQGQWRYQTQNNGRWSYIENFNVQPGNGQTTTGCGGSDRGNFGQLDSPRNPSVQHQRELALNIATGIDHGLVPLPDAVADECANPPREGEQLDNVSRDGNNCVLPDTGNDGPALADGLVSGVEGEPGKLDHRRGATNPRCGRSDQTVGGVQINNDVLSCFMLDPNEPLSSLTVDTPADGFEPKLNGAILDSPRFVWLPEIYRNDRSSHAYQPIRRFVPAFITDEAMTSTRNVPTFTHGENENGVSCNGNNRESNCNSVDVLQVFVFNPDVLPVDERSAVTGYDPAAGRKVAHLVG